MKLAHKVFATVVGVASLCGGAVALLCYNDFKTKQETEFIRRYEEFGAVVAGTFSRLESVSDINARNLLKTMVAIDRLHGDLSQPELEQLAADGGVAYLNIFGPDGRLLQVSEADQNLGMVSNAYSLLELCAGYADFYTNNLHFVATPFLASIHDQPSKFVMMPNWNGTRVFEAGVSAAEFNEVVLQALAKNNDIESISIYTPSGTLLASTGVTPTRSQLFADGNEAESWFGHRQDGDTETFAWKIQSVAADCCECPQHGASMTRDGYYYRLAMNVSRKPLIALRAQARRHVSYQLGFALLVSFILAPVLTRRITRRINEVSNTARSVLESSDLGLRAKMSDDQDEIAQLSSAFNEMLVGLQENQKRLVEAERLESIAYLSAQVAHDIRSPLAALNAVALEPKALPEDVRRLTLNAIARVQDIATLLFDHHKALRSKTALPASAELENTMLSSLVDSVVAEQRMRFKNSLNVTIRTLSGAASYGVFCRTQPRELKRVFANLITNAVEACNGKGRVGKVGIDLRADKKTVHIRVLDNGAGIPDEVLRRLGEKGMTHGKADGSGMGLFHAFESVRAWGGQIRVDSKEGSGTAVAIELPRAPAPAWFLESLDIAGIKKVAVLDDESTVHDTWDESLSTAASLSSVSVFHLSTPDDLRGFVVEQGSEETLFLIDYELLGYDMNGLDLIDECGIAASSVLVTSRFEEQAVIEGCMKAGISLVPKPVASHVPIVCTDPSGREFYDAVLIDDDDFVHDLWRRSSQNASKRLLLCKTVAEFYRHSGNISVHTPIYVDQDLDDDAKGIDVARAIYHRGFKTIYLATGHQRDEFSLKDAPWIREVLSKDPPWGRNQLSTL